MKFKSLILSIYFLLYINQIYAIIFFNPLVNNDGTPLYFNSDSISGILGWVDVPEYIAKLHQKNKIINEDKILVIKLPDNSLKFVLPSCPNIILPQGLYCWQSSWKKYVEQNDTLYQSLTRDISVINKMKAERQPIMYAQTNPYDFRFCYDFEIKKWTYRNPKIPVIIEYKTDCAKLLNLDYEINSQNCKIAIRKQFYDLMGTTEIFLREYLGAEPDQFVIPVASRDYIRIPKVEKDIVKQYYPAKLNSLNRDIINLAGKAKIYTQNKFCESKTQINEQAENQFDTSCDRVKKIDIRESDVGNVRTYSALQQLQMKPEFYDTIFVIFTNFDGLENVLSDPKSLIEDLSFEELSTTQANLIFRKYYQKDINLIDDLKDKIKVKDGIITEIKKCPSNQDLDKTKILYYKDVPVYVSCSGPVASTNNSPICSSSGACPSLPTTGSSAFSQALSQNRMAGRVNYVFTGIVNLHSKLNFKKEFTDQILINSIKNSCAIAKLNNKKKIVFNLGSLNYYGYDSNYLDCIFGCDLFNELAEKFGLEIGLI